MRVSSPAVTVGEFDPGPLARLAVVVGDAETPGTVFQRLCEGETPREIAKSWQVPVGRFTEWFMTEHVALYDAALKVRAAQDAHETVEIADGASAEDVGPAKLRISARQWRSSRWDRERYGDKTEVKHSGLMPTLVIEIAAAVGAVQVPRVIEAEAVEALPTGAVSDETI